VRARDGNQTTRDPHRRTALSYDPHAEATFGLDRTTIGGRLVAVREHVAAHRPFCRLVHFSRDTDRIDPRLLVVAPLSGQSSTIMRDLLAALLPEHDLHLLDWPDARDVPVAAGRFGLEDNIACVIESFRALGGDTHLLSLCQSAAPALAAAAILAGTGDAVEPRSLILISGLIDPRINPTRIGRLAASRSPDWFERHAIVSVPAPYPGKGRRVYPGSAQRTALLAYFLRHLSTGGELLQKVLADDGADAARFPFVDLFFRVIDLSADFFLDTVRLVFQEFALPRGRLTWRGERVDLSAIRRAALMTVEGEFDDVSGVGQTRIAHELCANTAADRRSHHLQRNVGHFGTFHGRAWRTEIVPRIRRFIRDA
jgi:poly(3-hydroxybutyrate) depolymerase